MYTYIYIYIHKLPWIQLFMYICVYVRVNIYIYIYIGTREHSHGPYRIFIGQRTDSVCTFHGPQTFLSYSLETNKDIQAYSEGAPNRRPLEIPMSLWGVLSVGCLLIFISCIIIMYTVIVIMYITGGP